MSNDPHHPYHPHLEPARTRGLFKMFGGVTRLFAHGKFTRGKKKLKNLSKLIKAVGELSLKSSEFKISILVENYDEETAENY